MWWNCLDRGWELCSRTPLRVKTLQDRLSGQSATGTPPLLRFGDSLVISLSMLWNREVGRRQVGVSKTPSLGSCRISCGTVIDSAHGFSWVLGCGSLFWAVLGSGLISDTTHKQVMMGAGVAGLMGRWRSAAVGNHGVKTGGVRHGNDSRSFSALSNSELSPTADPGW